jgi:hypothetical protein
MAALLGVWRVLIDYWIAPSVLGHELEIHPLPAVFTLIVGGLAGAYLALPVAAVIRVVWRRLSASRATDRSVPRHRPQLIGKPAQPKIHEPSGNDHKGQHRRELANDQVW